MSIRRLVNQTKKLTCLEIYGYIGGVDLLSRKPSVLVQTLTTIGEARVNWTKERKAAMFSVVAPTN